MITILALALDPFFQQIISYQPGPYPTGNTTMPSRLLFESGLDNIYAHPQITDAFQTAINVGLFFNGNLSDTFSANALQSRPRSSTGNVTFDAFETLAVCSECANITDHLAPPVHRDIQSGDGGSFMFCDPETGCWEWALPNGFTTGWAAQNGQETMFTTSGRHDPVVLDAHNRLPVFNFTAIAPGWIDGSSSAGPGVAQECMLYWCVNKYSTVLEQGVLYESLVSSYSRGSYAVGSLYSIQPPGSNASLYLNSSYSRNPLTFGEYEYPSGWINGTFFVNQNASDLLAGFLADQMTGISTLNGEPDFNGTTPRASVQHIYSIARAGHIDMKPVFDALALSMTTAVRNTNYQIYPDDGVVSVLGTETSTVTYVRVTWAWITLPVVLQVAALLFMCQALLSNARGKLLAWKSSALAVVFYGMKLGNQVEHDGVERHVDMVGIANKFKPQKQG